MLSFLPSRVSKAANVKILQIWIYKQGGGLIRALEALSIKTKKKAFTCWQSVDDTGWQTYVKSFYFDVSPGKEFLKSEAATQEHDYNIIGPDLSSIYAYKEKPPMQAGISLRFSDRLLQCWR